MPATKVQSVTGGGATLVLNGVAAGNMLTVQDSYFRSASTGVAEAIPTDSNGTFLRSNADVPIVAVSGDVGVGIFHQLNAAAGTHTVTPQANTTHNTTLTEWSRPTAFDVGKSAGDNAGNETSQVTGTTAVTAQADELVLICLAVVASGGANPMGTVDPVAGFITLQLVDNDQTSVATHHSYKNATSIGAQSATENWTQHEASMGCMANIATFKNALTTIPPVGGFIAPVLLW